MFLKPIRKATSAIIVQYLEESIFHIFGVPEYLHSDNGKQFVSELFSSFLKRYGVKHIKTAFYSPQANASERVNRSVLAKIRSYLETDQRNWDMHASSAAFSLRSVIHDSISFEPYYAVFGSQMVQHGGSYELLRKLEALKYGNIAISNTNDKLELIRKKIFENLKLAHEKTTKTYNTRSRDIKYQVGQIVYRRNFKQSSLADHYNAKLRPKFLKSIVLKTIGNSLYELGNLRGEKVGTFHAKDIHT